ncbi:MAG: hypothetical protein PVH40_05430 [Gemmatimonadales bacterium]|jgi:hypothetical protein
MSDYDPRLIRFVRATVDVAGDRCTAEVEVESPGHGSFVCSAQGGINEADQLRAVARATADALSDAFQADNATVRVVGVQVVDAVPHNAVMVTLAASKGAQSKTLLGICDGGSHDTATATALAVLNATNRFLSRGR